MESQDVGSLVARLRQVTEGDSSAMAWFYDALAPRLYRRLKYRYQYPGGLDAEELLQDAFLYFFKRDALVVQRFLEAHAGEAVSEGELVRYLWNLACGVASNRLRTVKRQRAEVPIFEGWDPPARLDSERRHEHRDELTRLANCVRGKGERLFLYYRLRFLDGLTPQEIAQATGWTQRTTYRVRQLLNDAVGQCADTLRIVR